ncbi:MFS transporter [Winogradskyella helgolandensis]|uniref:MFS transporter n=1 Tax=Winogradskyella helgolandensis TaxID=2697010 RepID=UPI0015CB053A|nr:MFS transporter [Winogradskyella helgolandensis]
MSSSKKHIAIITGVLFLITASVNLEMPLFRIYTENEHFGVGMVGFAFASYIGGLLPTALLFGGLSDKIGKKKVLIIALLLSTLSVLIISLYPNLYVLFVSRVLVGCAVALSIATGSSFLSDLFTTHKATKSSNIVALSTALGFGSGALFTGIYLAYYTTLVPLTYWVVLVASVVWLLISMTLPESKFDVKKKMIKLPLFPKGALKYNISVALFWAATGVVISIIPTQISKFDLGGWSGLSLFLINGTGALFLPIAKRFSVRHCMTISYILLPIGFTSLTYGSLNGYLPFVLAGCAIVGMVAYGFGYFGTLKGVSELNPKEKPRVVSGYLLYGYLGFGVPSIVLGLSSESFGIENSLLSYLSFTIAVIGALLFYHFKKETSAAVKL